MRAYLTAMVAIAVILATGGSARANRFVLGTGAELSFGAIGSVNIGDQVGVASDGGNDLTGRQLGVVISAGIVHGPLSGAIEAGLGIGGLDQSAIEQRYYGTSNEQVGGVPVVRLGAVGRYTHPVRGAWAPMVELGAGWQRLAASSPAGSAHLDTLYVEPAGGVSVDLSPATPGGAHIDVIASLRICRVLQADLSGHSSGAVSPAHPATFAEPGVRVRYRYVF